MPKKTKSKSNRWSNLNKFIPLQLSLLLLLLTVLRLPNFFEPYWYGDEAIYLTLGQALNDGAVLYQDIIDHKTPIIYYLARTDSQFNFRLLFYFWMLATTSFWYLLARKVWRSDWAAFIGGLFFVIVTTLPWFEGHIPNGELFVLGFVVLAMWLLWQTKYAQRLIGKQQKKDTKVFFNPKEYGLLISAGSFLGLGILTKVPALFDYVAAAGVGWFTLTNNFSGISSAKIRKWLRLSWVTVGSELLILLGVLLPILASVYYFSTIGAGRDYLDYGLLYNFHYAGNWDLGITQPWLSFWFTLPGKVIFLFISLVTLSALRKFVSGRMQWILIWFVLALVASLLSNRPYPHYFLQLAAPMALLVAGAGAAVISKHRSTYQIVARFGTLIAVLGLLLGLMLLMKVSLYPAYDYYKNTWQYITGQQSQLDYYQSFNGMMQDNYQAASYLQDVPGDNMFIWGTNPMLYALSERHPVGRFTVSFHIHDFGAYEETISALQENPPNVIVVMHDEQTPLPGLDALLDENYQQSQKLDHFTIWQSNSSFDLKLEAITAS